MLAARGGPPMKRLALAFSILILGFASGANAQKKEVRVPFLQYPLGGGWEGYFIFDRLVADAHPWLRPFQQETPGYVYNLKLFARDKNMQRTPTFGSSTDAEWLADKGIKSFFDELIKVDWKWLYGETLHAYSWLVSSDSRVKTVADLNCQPRAIVLKSQTHWGGFTCTLFSQAYGITLQNTFL